MSHRRRDSWKRCAGDKLYQSLVSSSFMTRSIARRTFRSKPTASTGWPGDSVADLLDLTSIEKKDEPPRRQGRQGCGGSVLPSAKSKAHGCGFQILSFPAHLPFSGLGVLCVLAVDIFRIRVKSAPTGKRQSCWSRISRIVGCNRIIAPRNKGARRGRRPCLRYPRHRRRPRAARRAPRSTRPHRWPRLSDGHRGPPGRTEENITLAKTCRPYM